MHTPTTQGHNVLPGTEPGDVVVTATSEFRAVHVDLSERYRTGHTFPKHQDSARQLTPHRMVVYFRLARDARPPYDGWMIYEIVLFGYESTHLTLVVCDTPDVPEPSREHRRVFHEVDAPRWALDIARTLTPTAPEETRCRP